MVVDWLGLTKVPITESAELIYEKQFNINSTVSLLAALVLTFTFSLDSVGLDLGEGWPDAICPGWSGYRADGSDWTQSDDCDRCRNIWQTCRTSDVVSQVYQGAMMLSSSCCLLSVMMCVGMILNYATIPKENARAYTKAIGWRSLVGRALMNWALSFFAIGGLTKFSLIMPVVTFCVSAGVLVLCIAVYVVADSGGRSRLGAFLLPLPEDQQ